MRDELLVSEIDRMQQDLWDLSQKIFALHEIRFEEQQSSIVIQKLLMKNGMSLRPPISQLPTAFVADFAAAPGKLVPHIAFVAEFDALPELGHACGHNLIAAMSAGAALTTMRWLQFHQIEGLVSVVGTPAEEGGGGKVVMLDQGLFRNIDVALMLHPSGVDEVRPQYLAREGIDLEFYGKASHAAAGPQYGINALDAVVTFYQLTQSLRSRLFAGETIHGIITHGGDSPNVVPAFTSARFLVRAPNQERVNALLAMVLQAAEAAAQGTGARFEWHPFVPFYDAMNHQDLLSTLVQQGFESVGRHLVHTAHPHGSTDMGNVSQQIPAVHANIGLGADLVPHTAEFCDAAQAPSSLKTLTDGAYILASVAIALLRDPALLAAVKKEHRDAN